ncbi:hypothetical protein B296_00027397 [Ensete ventricosum]|uniref:Uncharacterized protein n=1 Tax=Ensete ventricosum TaxID=4639 RepID=A0A426ZQB1_ENSVE|nr:hypothetical protein B296_00027397 [Ensete ventricosum]
MEARAAAWEEEGAVRRKRIEEAKAAIGKIQIQRGKSGWPESRSGGRKQRWGMLMATMQRYNEGSRAGRVLRKERVAAEEDVGEAIVATAGAIGSGCCDRSTAYALGSSGDRGGEEEVCC